MDSQIVVHSTCVHTGGGHGDSGGFGSGGFGGSGDAADSTGKIGVESIILAALSSPPPSTAAPDVSGRPDDDDRLLDSWLDDVFCDIGGEDPAAAAVAVGDTASAASAAAAAASPRTDGKMEDVFAGHKIDTEEDLFAVLVGMHRATLKTASASSAGLTRELAQQLVEVLCPTYTSGILLELARDLEALNDRLRSEKPGVARSEHASCVIVAVPGGGVPFCSTIDGSKTSSRDYTHVNMSTARWSANALVMLFPLGVVMWSKACAILWVNCVTFVVALGGSRWQQVLADAAGVTIVRLVVDIVPLCGPPLSVTNGTETTKLSPAFRENLVQSLAILNAWAATHRDKKWVLSIASTVVKRGMEYADVPSAHTGAWRAVSGVNPILVDAATGLSIFGQGLVPVSLALVRDPNPADGIAAGCISLFEHLSRTASVSKRSHDRAQDFIVLIDIMIDKGDAGKSHLTGPALRLLNLEQGALAASFFDIAHRKAKAIVVQWLSVLGENGDAGERATLMAKLLKAFSGDNVACGVLVTLIESYAHRLIRDPMFLLALLEPIAVKAWDGDEVALNTVVRLPGAPAGAARTVRYLRARFGAKYDPRNPKQLRCLSNHAAMHLWEIEGGAYGCSWQRARRRHGEGGGCCGRCCSLGIALRVGIAIYLSLSIYAPHWCHEVGGCVCACVRVTRHHTSITPVRSVVFEFGVRFCLDKRGVCTRA